jgi:hypothetical protein
MTHYNYKVAQGKVVSYYSYVTGRSVSGPRMDEKLGGLLLRRLPLSSDDGYYRIVRVTVEWLEE